MTIFCHLTDLINESDVEQKLIVPLLTSGPPLGLGYLRSDFRTKPDIRQIPIGKGLSEKLYYPDYVIIIRGLPLLIIEIKHPAEDLTAAFREARLYAAEINAKFSPDINPCHKIIAANGKRIVGGLWDSDEVKIDIEFDDIFVQSPKYVDLMRFGSKETISTYCERKFKSIRGDTIFVKPLRLLGGKTVQNEDLEQNGFGASLALEYRHLFNPNTIEDRRNIVKNAYVPSKRRLKHIDPIDKIIRAAKPPSMTYTQLIEDTSKPSEIVETLKKTPSLKHELLLLVGGVGSGKSTFADYLREIALPKELREDTVWISIDLNVAPLSKTRIYDWIVDQLNLGLKASYPEIDFEDIGIIRKVYSTEIRRLEKGPGALFEKGSEKYNELIAVELHNLQNDREATSKALVRYLCKERAKSLIIVLDNCDKRTRDDQLLMFDVAKWLQKEWECLVFLPIRDTTFDHHRREPPLDTAIKDLVFRIDPPLLIDVIYKRVGYALSQMKVSGSEVLSYELPNGMRVEYPRSEQGMYLACILRSLFHSDNFFRRVITGIAGRDIRKGLEIFLDFCKSGHIGSGEILKIRQSGGNHILPKYIVTRVLLRGNRKYYQDPNSHIKNLFNSYPEDTIPDPFVRMEILRWLKSRYRIPGPNGISGFHMISQLILSLAPLGHSEERIRAELYGLIKAGCIMSESQDPETRDDGDLVIISPSGHVHLDLLGNIDYLSSCAEDTWYKSRDTAERISKRITNQIGVGHLSKECSIANAEDLLVYLQSYRRTFASNPDVYLEKDDFEELCDFTASIDALENAKKGFKIETDMSKLLGNYPPGTIVDGEVVSIQKYGIFIEFGVNGQGFLPISRFARQGDGGKLLFEDIETGDVLKTEVIGFNEEHGRFTLKPVLG